MVHFKVKVPEDCILGHFQPSLLITGAVYAGLLALPGRTEAMLDEFLAATGVRVDWQSSEEIWRSAGRTVPTHRFAGVPCSHSTSGCTELLFQIWKS